MLFRSSQPPGSPQIVRPSKPFEGVCFPRYDFRYLHLIMLLLCCFIHPFFSTHLASHFIRTISLIYPSPQPWRIPSLGRILKTSLRLARRRILKNILLSMKMSYLHRIARRIGKNRPTLLKVRRPEDPQKELGTATRLLASHLQLREAAGDR